MAEPAYQLSIPSIEDDTPLECRIYHPKDLHTISSGTQHNHVGVKGAVIAHPYSPLGGCYDDSVVIAVTESLLDQGFIVGTFNFRGASGSEGRTTLTGKAEQEDYISFAAFMIYYLHGLGAVEDSNVLEPILSVGDQLDNNAVSPRSRTSRTNVKLLLGGYSYGSLILARLPAVTTIIQRLHSADVGTAGAEILLRARTLAKQTRHSSEELHSPVSARGRSLRPGDAATSPTKRMGASPITVGGEETDPSERRRSRDSRRSVDLVRKSVELPRRIRAHVIRSSTPNATTENDNQHSSPSSPTSNDMPTVTTRYLAISPVLLPFTHMLCPPGPPSLMPGLRRSTSADAKAGDKFLESPTLAIFGSADVFTASRRLKAWAQKMSRESKSTFVWHEIEGAGHFWRETGVMEALQERIAAWTKAS